MRPSNQKGSALIFALIFMLVLSVMAASLMFLAQSETWASGNYRMMTQARYGAEAGVNAAANYLVNTYPSPGSVSDPISAYNMTVSPVTNLSNVPIVLSAMSGQSSNYPASSVQTAFNTAGQGSYSSGGKVSFASYAQLLSMQQVTPYGSTTPTTVQTWLITADGNIASAQNAQVEVSAILERQAVPYFNYAAFATANACGALQFGGGASTNSYDSSALVMVGGVPTPVLANSGGNIGSNGNLNTIGSGTVIYGSLSTPRTGVGSCAAGGTAAWSSSGGATVTGGIKQLPQPVTYPTPVIPPPGSTNYTYSKLSYTLAPGSYGDISLVAGATLTLTAGTYNINSLTLAGVSTLILSPGTPPQPIILNVTGTGIATPVDFTGGTLANPTLNPAIFQLNYAGTGTIKMAGGSQAAGLINAPNAPVQFVGGSTWLGAALGQTVTDMGGTSIYYDRRLQKEFFKLSPYMLDSFTWNKY